MVFPFLAKLIDCVTGLTKEASMTKVNTIYIDLVGRLA